MPEPYSTSAQTVFNAVSTAELPLFALEITHPDFTAPLRVVNDRQDIIIQGVPFRAGGFRLTLPDQQDKQVPQARLTIDNTGREIMQLLEDTNGAEGAQVRIIQIIRSDPDTIEADITLDMGQITVSPASITAEIGFDALLNRPAVPYLYRPDTAPGLF